MIFIKMMKKRLRPPRRVVYWTGREGVPAMSIGKYQIFLKTVELGSFTAAARVLNFTQSGVSHAIGSLEEELGVTLLWCAATAASPPRRTAGR